MSTDTTGKITVLYFAGSGRSGTTLVNSILGSMPGAFAGGELRYLWERGAAQNHLCSCGQPFDACPLWSDVMTRVRADPSVADLDPAGIGRRLLARLKVRQVPGVFVRRALRRPAVPAHPDDMALRALYRAVAGSTGAGVVVDSSKLPPYGMLLSQFPDLDVRVLHVVRDSRATAFSWLRTKKALDHGDDDALMPRQPIGKSSFLWLYWNLVTVLRWGRSDVYLRVRYEDFVVDPRAVMTRVCRLAGLDPTLLPFDGADGVVITPGHVVAGNPNRHSRGVIAIRPDSEWRGALGRRDAALVSALTAPGLALFGYPVWPTRAASAPPETHQPSRPSSS